MKKWFLLYLFFIPCVILPQSKISFDISNQPNANYPGRLDKSPNVGKVDNSPLSFTLLDGGYFTIGTNKGLSDNSLDDNCEITFGHPYAKHPTLFLKLMATGLS